MWRISVETRECFSIYKRIVRDDVQYRHGRGNVMNNKLFKSIDIPIPGTNPMASISARRYGNSRDLVILLNMDTNNPQEWDPLVEAVNTDKYSVLTYSYPDNQAEWERTLGAVLDFVESEEQAEGVKKAERIVLVGASRGGVTSLQVASKRGDERIFAIVAISVPLEYEGTRLYTNTELRMVTVPKLFISTEFDDYVEETRDIFAVVEDPRWLTIYPGDAHGTEIFTEEGESLALELTQFIEAML